MTVSTARPGAAVPGLFEPGLPAVAAPIIVVFSASGVRSPTVPGYARPGMSVPGLDLIFRVTKASSVATVTQGTGGGSGAGTLSPARAGYGRLGLTVPGLLFTGPATASAAASTATVTDLRDGIATVS